MRSFYTIYITVALLLSFTACEMKEEIKNKPNSSSEMGRLALDLSVKNNTKASDEANDFPVVIVNKETGETAKSFNSYSDLLEQNPIELPVGTYSVTANSAGEYNAIMSYPYFKGNQDVAIEKNVSSEANVICKMQNVKFALTLSADFTTTFKDYAVTVVNGSTVYDCEESAKGNYDPVYFKMENNTTKIDMKVIATTFEGTRIEYDVPITKGGSDGGDGGDSAFEGGDALNITLKPTTDPNPDDPTPEVPGVGIKVTVAFTFAESEETIIIEINGNDANKPNPDPDPTDPDPNPGEGDKPTMSCEYFETGIQFKSFTDIEDAGTDVPSVVDVEISTKNKIEHLYVTITSTSNDFMGALELASLEKQFDMTDLNAQQSGLFDSLGLPYAGIKGSENYTFSIGNFMKMLGMFPGTHTFSIEVLDAKDLSLKKQLVVTATN